MSLLVLIWDLRLDDMFDMNAYLDFDSGVAILSEFQI